MKHFKILLLFFIVFASTTVYSQNAKEVFLGHLEMYENYIKGKYDNQIMDMTTFIDANKFLATVTGIKTNALFAKDEIVKEWRVWFEKNKEKLYWDEKEKMVKVKSNE